MHTIVTEAVNKTLKAQKQEQEEEANNIDALLNLNLNKNKSESEWHLTNQESPNSNLCLDNELHVLRSTLINNKKPEKLKNDTPKVPIAFGVIINKIKNDKSACIKILLDSGASSSIINSESVKGIKFSKSKVIE